MGVPLGLLICRKVSADEHKQYFCKFMLFLVDATKQRERRRFLAAVVVISLGKAMQQPKTNHTDTANICRFQMA